MNTTLDNLQDTIDEVLEEILNTTDPDEYIRANEIYFELSWFYHAGVEAGQYEDIHDEVVDSMYDASENWSHRNLDDLGSVLEDYFLTGYHGASKLGEY